MLKVAEFLLHCSIELLDHCIKNQLGQLKNRQDDTTTSQRGLKGRNKVKGLAIWAVEEQHGGGILSFLIALHISLDSMLQKLPTLKPIS